MRLPAKSEQGNSVGTADAGLPLPTLLSQALVAFTIEFDNEFERQMPHRTTNHGSKADSRQGPWLVSLVMWSNCMRFVGEEGVRVRELEGLARTTTNLNGMERWGYIVVEPDPTDSRPKPPRSDWVIRATLKGGGLLVKGDILDHSETEGKNTTSSYSQFVDVYDSKGNFQHRFTGDELKLEDTYFWGVDHTTGKAYFKGDNAVIEAEMR